MTRRARVAITACAVLATAALLAPPPARAFPAFARKYGLRCTACHEAWPKLNDFGRAFRDNGYQLLTGKDDTIFETPGYWPVAIRITPQYAYSQATNQPTDSGTRNIGSGGVAQVGMDLLMGGVLFQNVSFLVVPTGFAPDGAVVLESAWVRFDNLFGSSWANVKLGRHEVDLPLSAHRPWNLSSTGYLIYSFHASGSQSVYDMGENQWGVELMGHDRGSLNRVSVSVFSVQNSIPSQNVWSVPGVYGHATHEWLFESGPVSEAKLGVFGSYTSWPTTFVTSGDQTLSSGALEPSTKIGGEGQIWFGPRATPFHLTLVYAHGEDNQALIPDATRNGTFNGGYAELGWTFDLKNIFFARYDLCKNSQQGVVGAPQDLNDMNAITAGWRHTFQFSNRSEYALHLEYSSLQTKRAGDNGLNTRTNQYVVGIDFAY